MDYVCRICLADGEETETDEGRAATDRDPVPCCVCGVNLRRGATCASCGGCEAWLTKSALAGGDHRVSGRAGTALVLQLQPLTKVWMSPRLRGRHRSPSPPQ